MFFQIKEVVLWPRNPQIEPRRLIFELGKVNVITGASRTGKSAIVPIIDYCLGASVCSIPVGTIRIACAWFGIVVALKDRRMLLARKNPENQKQSGEMFVVEGNSIDIPKVIGSKDENVENIKLRLDQMSGLPMLNYGEENKGYAERPSFRDLVPFLFQIQNIIANRDVLFYKMNEYKYQERLRLILPYALNAVNAQWFYNRHLLLLKQKQLRAKEKLFERNKIAFQSWVGDIRAKVLKAKELGLVDKDISLDGNPEYLLGILKEVARSKNIEQKIDSSVVKTLSDDILNLRTKEEELSLKLSKMRRRIIDMDRLKSDSFNYHSMLKVVRDRLFISKWIENEIKDSGGCPFCDCEVHDHNNDVSSFVEALRYTENEIQMFSEVPAAFDREYALTMSEIERTSSELSETKKQIQTIDHRSKEEQQFLFTLAQANRFVGGLEEAINNFSSIQGDGLLVNEINELKQEIAAVYKLVSSEKIRKRKDHALAFISQLAGEYIKYLDTESPFNKIDLDIESLTIIIREKERNTFLWEVGSGSNWLAYHLTMILALHSFFLSVSDSPVPSFVVFDQPSQVYFPRKVYVQLDDGDYWSDLKDDDLESVKKIFYLMNEISKNASGNLQLFVFDHAPKEIWESFENIHLVETWRDGQKLIPLEWL